MLLSPAMDALAFLERHGREVAERVSVQAGTTYAYFNQIAYGHRRPSPDLARELVAATVDIIPNADERLDFEALLPPKRAATA